MSIAKTVLVLEDDMLVAEGLRADLEALGLTVLGPAYDCSAALELLMRERPDLAVLDTRIGSETCEVVLEECHALNVPVIIASGHAAADLPVFAVGFPLLPKPYLSHQLHQLVGGVA